MSSKKNKIAVLIYSLAGGGAERVVSQLIPYLEDKNKDVYLVVMNATRDYDFQTKNPLYFLEKSRPNENSLLKFLKLPFLAWKYHQFLKRNNINTSISFLTRPAYISILTKIFNKNRNILISERSNPSKQYGENNFHSKINIFLIKYLYPKSNLIITNSKGTKLDLINKFQISEDLISTIYNPIDIEKIENILPETSIFDTNYFNIITVGRLDRGKNHVLLIKVMALLKQEKVRLYILGKGPLNEELNGLIAKLGLSENVFLLGFDENPYKYMKAANLFVFSSNHEGFPNVVLEALACKLPIVSTNCPYGPNEIMNAEVKFDLDTNLHTDYGILTPLNNKTMFHEALLCMLQDPKYRKQCIEKSSERVQLFSKDLILEEYFQTINSFKD
ncbi:glycosyltransferase [Flavobacterium sp. 20NA77.7]|uniref:Glycosyltransferase n=1 Tax=Flavobacterium nakdongensis TaxID=3073563 RepID=A0ABY9RAY4_9FLAO|nr:glycosyltransferase [Flavobacterium sp. 20NA77.7]WMW77367.1 glycosyltransferase [Flavobacterium sp. 20NA77.7]